MLGPPEGRRGAASFGLFTAQKTKTGVVTAYSVCVLPNQLYIYYAYAGLAAGSAALYALSCCLCVRDLRYGRARGLPVLVPSDRSLCLRCAPRRAGAPPNAAAAAAAAAEWAPLPCCPGGRCAAT
jgi:hypothetical protein